MDDTKKALTKPLPPHARIMGLRFDPDGRTLHLRLDADRSEALDAGQVRSLHVLRLHHDDWAAADKYDPSSDEMHHFMVNPTHEDRYQLLLGVSVDGWTEVLYLTLDAFNYREALGDQAELTGAANRPRLLEKLGAWCASAHRDGGFDDLLHHRPPPVADSLAHFLERVRG